MSKLNKTTLIISMAVLLVLAWMVTLSVMASGAEQGVILVPADSHLEACDRDPANFGGMTETADDSPPAAPANICVIPGRGQPTIVWDADTRADWYQIYIGGPSGQALLAWYPKAGDNTEVPFGDTVSTKVQCEGLTCTLQPFVFPPAATYDVWIQSWGSPTASVDDGQFGVGGPLADFPSWNTADESFSYPSTQSGPLTNTMTPTIGSGGEFTLYWEALPYATWYNVWIGTAPDEWTQAFYGWLSVDALGCEYSMTCTLTAGTVVYDTGSPVFDAGPFDLTLAPDEYIYYIQSWGPAGFGNGGDFTGALAPWQEGPTFTVE